jgi:hypothetical protein
MKHAVNYLFKVLMIFGIILISCKTGFAQTPAWTTNVDTITTTGYVKMTGLVTDTTTDFMGIDKHGKLIALNGIGLNNVLYPPLPILTVCDTNKPLWYKGSIPHRGALVTRACTWVGVGEAGMSGVPNAPLSVSNGNSVTQFTIVNPTKFTNRFTIDTGGVTYIAGKVGIGTQPSTYMLDVKGVVRANEVKVCVFGTCDFVFDKNYNLMPLADLQNYLNLNHHLPGIASAQDMESSDGIALGKMNSQLLQKVEELTLYVLQQQKEIEELKAEIKNK